MYVILSLDGERYHGKVISKLLLNSESFFLSFFLSFDIYRQIS